MKAIIKLILIIVLVLAIATGIFFIYNFMKNYKPAPSPTISINIIPINYTHINITTSIIKINVTPINTSTNTIPVNIISIKNASNTIKNNSTNSSILKANTTNSTIPKTNSTITKLNQNYTATFLAPNPFSGYYFYIPLSFNSSKLLNQTCLGLEKAYYNQSNYATIDNLLNTNNTSIFENKGVEIIANYGNKLNETINQSYLVYYCIYNG